MAYGNVDLKKGGSLDYKVFGGHIPMSTRSGASDYFNTDIAYPNVDIKMDDAFGASLFWNTPLQGFRVGYSFSRYDNLRTLRGVPWGTNTLYMYKVADTYDRHLASLEYTWGNWVFAAEGGVDDMNYDTTLQDGTKVGELSPSAYYFYTSATWRPKKWLELGTYYSNFHADQYLVGGGLTFPQLNQHDIALSTRFNFTDYLYLKLEGHYLNGSGAVFDLPSKPQPQGNCDQSWGLFAAKVGFAF